MCVETMDTETAKFPRQERVRHEFKPTWTPFCDQTAAKWTFQSNRNMPTVQKNPARDHRLAQRAELAPFLTEPGRRKKRHGKKRAAVACNVPQPAGGMAPRNTTQYLMSNVYEDMKMDTSMRSAPHLCGDVYCEDMSPSSVSAALDSCFEDILLYQLRDFEELYHDSTWKPE